MSRKKLLIWRKTCLGIRRASAMSFALYLIGYVVLIAGLAWGARLLNVPPRWIGVGVVVLAGIGIVSAVTHTRRRDSAT